MVSEATGLDVVGTALRRAAGGGCGAQSGGCTRADAAKRSAVIRLPGGTGETTTRALADLRTGDRLSSFPHHAKAGENPRRHCEKIRCDRCGDAAMNPVACDPIAARGEVVHDSGLGPAGGLDRGEPEARAIGGNVGRGSTRCAPGKPWEVSHGAITSASVSSRRGTALAPRESFEPARRSGSDRAAGRASRSRTASKTPRGTKSRAVTSPS
jgi:hypothetical protein